MIFFLLDAQLNTLQILLKYCLCIDPLYYKKIH
jgi:hypothetical protein